MKMNTKKSRFLTKEECGDGIVDSFVSFSEGNVAPVGATPELRWIGELCNHKPMVLNPTNNALLTAMFGSDDGDDWLGKPVEFFNDQSVFFNGNRGGIRVRHPRSSATARSSVPPPQSSPEGSANGQADTQEDMPW